MGISESKERTSIIIDKSDKEKLKKIAASQNRSLNNLVETIIKAYLHAKDTNK